MNRIDRLIQSLERQFPGLWLRPGHDFGPAYLGTIWTGEGSHVDHKPAFNYYGHTRTHGVHPDLARALDRLDLYADFYDAGTVFIRPR
jgi:hypothetical protein